ncbi:hypothetical protein KSP40_PGU005702 [Platanthera guangdongensis]|uniref:Photosystem II protein L n=1 Tax=Platanthera guangdongensis TaxID=2320717 RepID=A0ABR2LG09_9ASPA
MDIKARIQQRSWALRQDIGLGTTSSLIYFQGCYFCQCEHPSGLSSGIHSSLAWPPPSLLSPQLYWYLLLKLEYIYIKQ